MKKILKIFTALFFAIVLAFVLSAKTGLPALGIFLALAALSLFVPMPKGVAFMAISYPTDCDDDIPEHACSDCEEVEGAGIRGVAFIKDGYTIANPLTAADWITGIESGDIIIIPKTRGSFDGGTPKTGPGYGNQKVRYQSTDYSLTYFDPGYKSNRGFYNAIKRSQKYKIAYLTETLVHLTDKVCQVLPKGPVGEDLGGEVVWEVNVQWNSKNEPTSYVAPAGIFVCFEVS